MKKPRPSKKKPATPKAPGAGVGECDNDKSPPLDLTAQNISQSADGVPFDWTCPRCGSVGHWGRPWNPEGMQPLSWNCGWCKQGTDGWIWVPKAGWYRCPSEEEREKPGFPYLDHDLRWLLVCECGGVHRPEDCEIIQHADGEPEFHDIHPTEFKIDCTCGRKRLFIMREGRWQQESFEYQPPVPKPPAEPLPPPEDKEPLLPVQIKCFNCGDSIEVEARSHINHDCKRCGRHTHLAKHRVYHCEKCGEDFEWLLRGDEVVWCNSCQGRSEVTDTGKVVWDTPPNTGGSTNIAGEFRDKLYGRDDKDGLLQAYEKAERPGKANIAEEACQMADALLKFLVTLAGHYQDFDAVRWLSYHAELGKRRVPQDDWESIEDKLTSEDRKLAAKEWLDVQEHLRKTKPHVSKSVFSTVVRRIANDARWWRFGWMAVENAKRAEERDKKNLSPRLIFEDGVPGQINKRKIQWLRFLEGWGIKRSNAPDAFKRGDEIEDKWFAIPYPATYDETGSVESLIDEVLIPVFSWWLVTDREDCRKKRYPKKGALNSRIRTALGLHKAHQNENSPNTSEAVQDG